MGDTVQKTPRITIIIPHRMNEDASVTLNSLSRQTFTDFDVIVVPDEGRGAPWARNEGFKGVTTEFTLFCDNDITWKNHALETMVNALDKFPRVSYAYGRYYLGKDLWSNEAFDPILLKHHNYISTMSLIRTKDLPEKPWDENIRRLQDWDLWLTLLEQGKRGIYVEDLLFTTPLKDGISHNGVDYLDAILTVRKKHGID